MVNFKEKASNVIHAVERKSLPVAASVATAISALTVNAFAEELSSSTVDYSKLSTSILSGFSQIITNCIDIASAVIPLGVGLIAMGKMWDVAKKFFNKTTR